MFEFIPKKLIQVRKEIESIHSTEGKTIASMDDFNLKKFIYRLVQLDEKKLDRELLVLSSVELFIIVDYIFTNEYNVDLRNLQKILEICDLIDVYSYLFEKWQQIYDIREVNNFLGSHIIKNDNMKKVLNNNDSLIKDYLEILRVDNIPIFMGKLVMNTKKYTSMTFEERLSKYYLIDEESQLYKDIKFLFYTYCDKEDYIEVDINELISILKQYDTNKLRLFLKNFLLKFSITELAEKMTKFILLVNYLYSRLGEKYSKPYKDFFSKLDDNIRIKYDKWMNIYKIYQAFNGDERYKFWSNYYFKNIGIYKYSNACIMETNDYYIIEFLGKAMGPIYIFNRNIFEEKYKIIFSSYYSNSEARKYLYDNKDEAFERIEHRGYWKDTVSYVLRTYKIVDLIKD